MDFQKLLDWYVRLGEPSPKQLKSHQEFHDVIKNATSFLDASSGRVSFSLRMRCIREDITSMPICPVCQSNHLKTRDDQFTKTCSKACATLLATQTTSELYEVHPASTQEVVEKRKKTSIEKYGTDNPMKSDVIKSKHKEIMIDKYGVDNPSKLEFVKEKRNDTMMRLYGVKSALQSKKFFKKSRETLFTNYGVYTPIHSVEIMEKRRSTNLEKYGNEEHLGSLEFHKNVSEMLMDKFNVSSSRQLTFASRTREILFDGQKLQEHYDSFSSTSEAAHDLGIIPSTYVSHMAKYDILPKEYTGGVSFAEKEIRAMLDSLNIEYISNDREILGGQECDIVVESHKLIIEYNGVYWHSDKFKHPTYHQDKTIKAHALGYNIIHVWEDDWINKKNIIINKIKHKLKLTRGTVYARSCKIKHATNSEVSSLYNQNHIQGHINCSIVYTLEHNGEIVAAMSFKNLGENSYELVRYATSANIVGGFSKLLKRFVGEYSPKSINTFASLDYSNGDVYVKNGFTLTSRTKPNYWYVKNGKRHSRMMFMKSKLHNKLPIFDPSISEYDNMINNGYLRLYDSGSLKFKMVFE